MDAVGPRLSLWLRSYIRLEMNFLFGPRLFTNSIKISFWNFICKCSMICAVCSCARYSICHLHCVLLNCMDLGHCFFLLCVRLQMDESKRIISSKGRSCIHRLVLWWLWDEHASKPSEHLHTFLQWEYGAIIYST